MLMIHWLPPLLRSVLCGTCIVVKETGRPCTISLAALVKLQFCSPEVTLLGYVLWESQQFLSQETAAVVKHVTSED